LTYTPTYTPTVTVTVNPSWTPAYSLVAELGSGGNGPLNWPTGIAVDKTGNIFVVDSGNARVEKLNSLGKYMMEILFDGNCPDWTVPSGVALEKSGNIDVIFNQGMTVTPFEQYSPSGAWVKGWNGITTFASEFSGIALDTSGNVHVTQANPSLAWEYDDNGNMLQKWSDPDSQEVGPLDYPTGIALDSLGNVYVANSDHGFISKFDPNGKLLLKWGWVWSSNMNGSPSAMAMDSHDHLFVVVSTPLNVTGMVQEFDTSGNSLALIGADYYGNGQIPYPNGVAVDTLGNVYVTSTTCECIQKYKPN
jgi:DNA-binding beta-propeller fold protein YncE